MEVKKSMAEELPLVVRWDTFPLDIIDPARRFQVSRWNSFVSDREARIMMGFWEAENGAETVGEISGATDEAILVLDGRLYVSAPGMAEQVAEPGDVIMATRRRETHIVAREPARAFFIIYAVDPDQYEQAHLNKGA
jgi:ethanolamine utilization protein EutQ (cupin superfamily)